MNKEELKKIWLKEESVAHIKGWDFSHIHGRYEEENDLPWDYEQVIKEYLNDDKDLLDYDTGGGEFLLSLNHPYHKTYATEGYPPNISLCKEKLLPLGINFKECNDVSNIPFDDESFDLYINRHGNLNAKEAYRLLKKDGLFISEQVGADNDFDLVKVVLPDATIAFPDNTLVIQKERFINAGFEIIKAEEAYRPIEFYDVGAFVWFARIIEWEFPGFSVDKCFNELLKLQETIEKEVKIVGTISRFLIVAKK